MPVKRWNFRKAKWSHYNALTNQLAKSLLPPDTSDVDRAYQDFCHAISTAAQKYIPRGRRNNHIPCWDAECENLYQMFLQSPEGSDSSRAASALLSRLDRKRRDRWSEAVQTIDFSHSSRKAWSILNNLTGRSRRSPRHCAVSANAIASVLVNNSKYEDIDRKSSRLVSQEVSDLWSVWGPLQQVQWMSVEALLSQNSQPPSNIWNQEKLQAQTLSALSFCSMLELPWNPGCVAFFHPVCTTSKFQKSGEERWLSRYPNQWNL